MRKHEPGNKTWPSKKRTNVWSTFEHQYIKKVGQRERAHSSKKISQSYIKMQYVVLAFFVTVASAAPMIPFENSVDAPEGKSTTKTTTTPITIVRQQMTIENGVYKSR